MFIRLPVTAQAHPFGWRDKLAAWLPICAEVASLEEEVESLRYVAMLLCEAPREFKPFFGAGPDMSEIERFLDMAAIETVAARLVELVPHGYMLSRSAAGRTACTVVLPGSKEEVAFESESESLARVGAVLSAVLRASDRIGRTKDADRPTRH